MATYSITARDTKALTSCIRDAGSIEDRLAGLYKRMERMGGVDPQEIENVDDALSVAVNLREEIESIHDNMKAPQG